MRICPLSPRSSADLFLFVTSWAAEGLAYTCYAMYAENRHGLGPEDVQFKSTDSKNWGKVLKVR